MQGHLTVAEPARAELERWFPGLEGTDWKITSPEDDGYNCLAFALGFQDLFIDPSSTDGTVWAADVPYVNTIEAYLDWFRRGGLELTVNEAVDGRFRVAIFANDTPQHFAVQLPTGGWISKLGKSFDVVHPLRALEGVLYGRVAAVMAPPT